MPARAPAHTHTHTQMHALGIAGRLPPIDASVGRSSCNEFPRCSCNEFLFDAAKRVAPAGGLYRPGIAHADSRLRAPAGAVCCLSVGRHLAVFGCISRRLYAGV